MKTVIVWDGFGEETTKFVVLDGDFSHLDGTYLNAADGDEKKQDELNSLMYDDAGGDLQEMLDKFPLAAVREESEIVVIKAGFIP